MPKTPVPTSTCVAGNGGVRSSKSRPSAASHQAGRAGRGRSDRASVSELLMRLRQRERRWMTSYRRSGHRLHLPSEVQRRLRVPSAPKRMAPWPRSIESARSGSHLNIGERSNPVVVRDQRDHAPGKPTARKAQSSSGLRKSQEANAGRRKATGIHNRPDRAPSRRDTQGESLLTWDRWVP